MNSISKITRMLIYVAVLGLTSVVLASGVIGTLESSLNGDLEYAMEELDHTQ